MSMTTTLKSNLLKLLSANFKYQALYNALKNDNDYYPALTIKQDSSHLSDTFFTLKKGNGRQSAQQSLDISFDNYLANVVTPEVNAYKAKHPNHPFDDRKFRLHDFDFKNENGEQNIVLSLGPSMYQEYQENANHTKMEAMALMLKGLEVAGEPYHFFAKTLGVTVVVVSAEQSVYLGERSADVDYAGVLGFVGGTAIFHQDLSEVDFTNDIRQELMEEIGLQVSKEADFQFIGIAGGTFTSELDLMFLYQSNMPNTFFENCNLTEHQRLVGIHNREEAQILLEQGHFKNDKRPKSLLYATRFGLKYLVNNYWK